MPMDQLIVPAVSSIEAGIGKQVKLGTALSDAHIDHIVTPSVVPLAATQLSILPLFSSSIGKLQNGVEGSFAEFSSRELLPAREVSVQDSPMNESSENHWVLTSHKVGNRSEPLQRSHDGENGVLLVKHAKSKEVAKDFNVGGLQDEHIVRHVQGQGERERQEAKNIEVETDAKELIGRIIRKRFGRKSFSGVIDSFDAQHNWFKVVYEDGDGEDLERVEVEALLLPLPKARTTLLCKRRSPEGVPDERSRELKKKKRLEKASRAVLSSKHSNKETIVVKGEEGKNKKLGNKIESQERGKSATGITLQEGIKRYLKKRDDTGQAPVDKGVKRKTQSIEIKTSKQKIPNFEITQNPRSSTMKSIGMKDGCANKGFTEPGITLLGSPTLKKFGRQFYCGNVISYNKETKLYTVRYEDGDEEDLAWTDLEPTLAGGGKKHTPTKPIWEKEKAAAVPLGAALQGTETRKKFGKKCYKGAVISYDKNTQFYMVEYEDGDREELELCELEPTLVQSWQGSTRSNQLSAAKLIKDSVGNEHRLDSYPAKLKRSVPKAKEHRDPGLRDHLIGSSTRKKFGRKFFDGNVIKFDKKTKLYKVSYEDGDEEDLEWSELKPILILEGSLASKMNEQHQGETSSTLDRGQQGIFMKSSSVFNHKSKSDGKRSFELEAGPLGRSIRKRFGRKFYNGLVVGFNRRTKLYKVNYEDGDEEELEWSQLEPSLVVEGKQDSAAKSSRSKLSRKGKTGSKHLS